MEGAMAERSLASMLEKGNHSEYADNGVTYVGRLSFVKVGWNHNKTFLLSVQFKWFFILGYIAEILFCMLQSVTKIIVKTAIWTIFCFYHFPLLTILRNNDQKLRQSMSWVGNIL